MDTSLFYLINQTLQADALGPVMVFLSRQNAWLFLGLYAYAAWRTKDMWLVGYALALSVLAVGLSDAIGASLKDVIERTRPCRELEAVNLLVYCPKSGSMPSNHAANAFAFVVPFWLLVRHRVKYALAIVAGLVALSRVYVGVHYPSDIAIGAVLGLAVGYAMVWASRRIKATEGDGRYEISLWMGLALITLFRYYYLSRGYLELAPDEAHYWEWTRRLDWSYYSKGPMIAWLIALGTGVLGDTELGLRFLAPLLSAGTSVFLYLLGRRMYGAVAGTWAAALYQLVPLYSVYGVVLTIDTPYMFFWALGLWLLWRVLERYSVSGWAMVGMVVGVGMLSKYTMAFFMVCAVLYVIARPEHRHLLKRSGPYVGVLAALVGFSPVLLWNATHGWVTFKHTAGHANVGGGFALTPDRFFEFTGSQVGVVTPLLIALMAIALYKGRQERRGSFLVWFSVPIVVFFSAKSLQGKVETNWAMMGYVTAILAFANVYLSNFGSMSKLKRALVIGSIALSAIVTVAAHYPWALDLPPKLNPSTRFMGWRELASEIDKRAAALGGDAIIFSDSYQVASELAFYCKDNPVTFNLNMGRRMNQYDFWPGLEQAREHSNGVFVTLDRYPLIWAVEEAFRDCHVEFLEIKDNKGRLVREFTLASCKDFRGWIRQRKVVTY